MEVSFCDESLADLEVNADSKSRLDSAIIRAFRKVMRIVRDAKDERDIRAMKSLRFEKLKGDRENQYSLRINDKWRLIFQISESQPKNTIRIIEIADYHH